MILKISIACNSQAQARLNKFGAEVKANMKIVALLAFSMLPLRMAADCACQNSLQILNPVKVSGEPLLVAVNCLSDVAVKTPLIWKTGRHSENVLLEPLDGATGYYNYMLVWLPRDRPGIVGRLLFKSPEGILLDANRKPISEIVIRVVKGDPTATHLSLDSLNAKPFGNKLAVSGGRPWKPQNGVRILRVEIPTSWWASFWQAPLGVAPRPNDAFTFESSECGNLSVGWIPGDESLIQILHWSDHRLIPEAGWRVKVPYPPGADEKLLDEQKKIRDADYREYRLHGCDKTTSAPPTVLCKEIGARVAYDIRISTELRNSPVALDAIQLETMRISQSELEQLSSR